MDNISWQYIAGFFDGEGCIGIYPKPRENTARVNVSMSQTEHQGKVLFEIQTFLEENGIEKFTIRRDPRGGNRVPLLQLYCVNRKEGAKFLALIEPYLRVKKVKAKEFIAWASANPSRRGARRKPVKSTTVKWVIELRKAGMSQEKIAQEVGKHQVWVSRCLKRNPVLTIPV